MIEWQKGAHTKLGRNFTTNEFACRCTLPACIDQKISPDLIAKLDDLREELGEPLYIRSGFRCAAHQQALRNGGLQTARGTSTHELGMAADIAIRDIAKLETLVPKYFLAIGTAPTFLHVDLRADKVRRWPY